MSPEETVDAHKVTQVFRDYARIRRVQKFLPDYSPAAAAHIVPPARMIRERAETFYIWALRMRGEAAVPMILCSY
jgi:hypothetical protein